MPAVTVGLLVAIVFSGFPAGTVLVMIPSFVITATALLGLGFVLAAWTVRIRDLSPLVVLSTRILTYSSPVLYAPEMLPERFWNLALVNPFFWPIAWWSTAWSGGNEAPNFFWVISGATAITLLLLGLTVFRRSQPQFGRYL
jgi:ABC-type polysaccharide/polyol phosphate export permease